ncbi:MAG: ribbon-helix-helix protein, CopG family [Blastocatellia bacterium]
MTELTIQADEQLITALRALAARTSTTIEDLVRQALFDYLQRRQRPTAPEYSFIGIGRSGRSDLSLRAEELLEQDVNRREGWSLE